MDDTIKALLEALEELRIEAGSWNNGCGCCSNRSRLADTEEWKALQLKIEALRTHTPPRA